MKRTKTPTNFLGTGLFTLLLIAAATLLIVAGSKAADRGADAGPASLSPPSIFKHAR